MRVRTLGKISGWLALAALVAPPAHAVAPVVQTVPWVATQPVVPHTSWSGKAITLKGAADQAGGTYRWSFGDGTPDATGTVSNARVIEAKHAYSGAANQIFTATLTVTNAANESSSRNYFVQLVPQTLPAEINVAIDEGLWALHKGMSECVTGQGCWQTSYYAETPANLNAFFVNGHLETGANSNPYTDTVRRGMKRLFTLLSAAAIPSAKTYPAPIGTVNPDSNANGLALFGSDGTYNYSSGIFMTAIVASGTPDAVATTGPANVVGRKYKDIVQDLVDGYAWGQSASGPFMGGWYYYGGGYNSSDNSINQWATIGLMAADGWGGTVLVPGFIRQANLNSLTSTQASTANCGAAYNGAFSYTDSACYFPWGPYGTTPAGMVQMVRDGIGRGSAQWDRTENFIRNNFCNGGASSNNIRAYYYGLFSFTKAMLLTPGGGLQYLANQPGNTNPIDWYAAEASAGAPCNGVARTLVNDQLATGNWNRTNDVGYHGSFATAWAIMMLNRTVFESGVPVAVATATPTPTVVGQTVTLSGNTSFHQDSSKSVVSWSWDLNNDGVYGDATGPVVSRSFPALGNYVVGLRVTDNGNPAKSASTTITVQVSIPPLAPTANAGGPYTFCPQAQPWFLDGTASVNPDQGQHQPGNFPGDSLTAYAWDLNGSNAFATPGAQPDVTAFYTGKGPGSYLAQLKVTDNTAAAYPSSGLGNLSSAATSTTVVVRATNDPACGCVANLAARSKSGKIQLTWTAQAGVPSYNVYRGRASGGPYARIASTASTYATFLDSTVVNGTTYYYVVRAVAANATESCQSNQASATASAR